MSDRKKSWREIDQSRDRGGVGQSPRQKSRLETLAEKKASTAAKKDLDKLFSGSKVSQAKKKEIETIKALRGTPKYFEELRNFKEKFGIPRDWELAILFLDHRDTDVVIETLRDLEDWLPKQKPSVHSSAKAKLKVLAVSTFDDSVIQAIENLQKKLI